MPGDEAVAFKATQPFSEQLAADSRQAVDQIGESPRARRELADDQEGPAIAGYVKCARQRAVLLVAMLGHVVSFENYRVFDVNEKSVGR